MRLLEVGLVQMRNATGSFHVSVQLPILWREKIGTVPRSAQIRWVPSALFNVESRRNCSGDQSITYSSVGNWRQFLSQGTSINELSFSGKGISDKYEKLWRNLFSDPSQWWDNRAEKPNSRFPDFKHKISGEGLWLMNGKNPPWVASEISAIPPGFSVYGRAQKLSRFNKAGQYEKTMESFEQMQQEGTNVDAYVFVHILNACAGLRDLDDGRRIHKLIIENGCDSNLHVSSGLVDMYTKCGSIDDAWGVFDKMPTRDVVSWTAMILGSVKCGQGSKALDLFHQMQRAGVQPDPMTFVGVINACASQAALEEGRIVHQQVIRNGFESNIYISSSLVDMYSKCGSVEDAWRVFSNMPTKNVVAWNGMILACVKCGEGLKALELFQQMQRDGIVPDPITFLGAFKACARIPSLEVGRRIHEEFVRSGCEFDIYVGSTLVDMYAKCGSIEDAWRVFNEMPAHDVVTWNGMILGFGKCGQGLKAIELFHQMEREGVKPDPMTFVAVLNACARSSALEEGKRVHEQIIESGCQSDIYVGSSLIDMYNKCGSIDDAWRVFDAMPRRDVVAWNGMILGCVQHWDCQTAFKLFEKMQLAGVEPNSVTFVGLLNACAKIAALSEGRRLHEQIIRSGFESDIYICNSLVDMYAKCGSVKDARRVFNNVSTCNAVGWNAMIMGYAMHGHAKEAIALFEQMVKTGIDIGEVTFICLLSACSHGGFVKEGMQYFESMSSVYGVCPTVEHYTCMVDILGRAGLLEDAEEMIKTMPLGPSAAAWMSLLGACRNHGNVEMGERALKQVLELDPKNASAYVLISNIYAAAGRWDSKAMAQLQRRKESLRKQPGCSWIEVNNEVHLFSANDRQHPQILKIHKELASLWERMTEAGFVPDIRFALYDVEEEKKQAHLCHHSERLAIVFGLMTTSVGTPLCVVKNLRVCGDCHTAIKFISKIVGREITVRDANRFHHFKDGLCSCGDYW